MTASCFSLTSVGSTKSSTQHAKFFLIIPKPHSGCCDTTQGRDSSLSPALAGPCLYRAQKALENSFVITTLARSDTFHGVSWFLFSRLYHVVIKRQVECILPSLRLQGWANPAYSEILPCLCEPVPSLMNLTFLVHEKAQVTDRLTMALKDLIHQSTWHKTYHLGVTGSKVSKACPLLLPPQACGSSTLDYCSKCP